MPVRRFAARILLGCASGYVACNYYGPDDLPGYGGGGQAVSGTPGSGGESSGGIANGGTSGAPAVEGGAGGFLNAEGGSAGDAGGQSGGAPVVEGGAPGAGATSGGSGGTTGGTTGTAGSDATGGVTPCSITSVPQPEVFNFENDTRIKNVYKPSSTGWRGNWVRSTYDSTSNGNEPTDPQDNQNLAALGSSGWEGGFGSSGSGSGSMRQNIEFNGGYDEFLGVLYPYELDGTTAPLVDVSGRTMTAQVQLGTPPRANCKFSAAAFSRSGNGYAKVIGEHVDLELGTWKAISFDLDLSVDKTKVISVGIEIATKCTVPVQGPTSSQITFFIDAVSLACDTAVASSLR